MFTCFYNENNMTRNKMQTKSEMKEMYKDDKMHTVTSKGR